MDDLLEFFAGLVPDSIWQDIRDAMPDWLRYLILAGCLVFLGYAIWMLYQIRMDMINTPLWPISK